MSLNILKNAKLPLSRSKKVEDDKGKDSPMAVPSPPASPVKEMTQQQPQPQVEPMMENPLTARTTQGLLLVRIAGATGLAARKLSISSTGSVNGTSEPGAAPAKGSAKGSHPAENVPPKSPTREANVGKEDQGVKKFMPYCLLEFDKNEVIVDAMNDDPMNPEFKYRAHFDVSREAELSVSIYQRVDGKSQEIFLGVVKCKPSFNDQLLSDQKYPLMAANQTDRMGGELHLQHCFKPSTTKAVTIDDFDLLKVIGKGSFGKVMQVRKKDTGRIYAMKIIRKANIVERDEVEHTLAERNVLAKINNPFVVNLKFSFQNAEKLYLVLAFVNGGELFHHLQNEGQFDENRARFYTAELLLALEHLHKYNIIYRDLKPENILLDYNGHIALCDFGLCKLNMTKENTTNTFCGTPEYLAPELLLGKGYGKVVDWWTVGVLLYEMLTGLPPFYADNVNEMYRKILHAELVFPSTISANAKSLLRGLLERDPTKRLGYNGAEEIRVHAFFQDINWQKLYGKKYQSPFKPTVTSEKDTSNFDEEFTSEVPLDSVVEDSRLSETIQQKFAGFTYNAEAALRRGSLV